MMGWLSPPSWHWPKPQFAVHQTKSPDSCTTYRSVKFWYLSIDQYQSADRSATFKHTPLLGLGISVSLDIVIRQNSIALWAMDLCPQLVCQVRPYGLL